MIILKGIIVSISIGLVGFYDDLVNLRWRYKIILPIFISLI